MPSNGKDAEELKQLRHENLCLEERLRRCRQFAQMAAHALKTPLISMHGYADILNEEYTAALDPEGRVLLQRLGYLIDVALGVVSSVHEYSIVQDVCERKNSVRVGEVVAGAINLNRRLIDEVGAEIVVPADLPTVWADRDLLGLAFSHLLANAAEAVRTRRRPRIEIRWQQEPGRYRFEIRDNGVGIARRELRTIFEPYRRLTPRPGAGLGLSIVKRIIEKHGGEIGVESRKGQGAAFWFTLPSTTKKD